MDNIAESGKASAIAVTAFDKTERKILKAYFKEASPVALGDYVVLLARMGGYLARKHDPPPGNTVIWRGISKLYEVRNGYELANVDN